jgi:hypothetical protein
MRTVINVEKPAQVSHRTFFWEVAAAFVQDPSHAELQGETWVLVFDRPHPPNASYRLAAALGEDCVAQKHTPDPAPVMSLLGPRAHARQPFDPAKFKEPSWRA